MKQFIYTQVLLTAALICDPSVLYAQTAAPLSGTVQTDAGIPLEFATVALHRLPDSIAIKTEFTDAQGRFVFNPPANGRYLLSASQIGFVRAWSGPHLNSEGSGPVLRLSPSSSTNLEEVRVVAKKPLYERLADRTVVNVEGSALAAGNTTLDVLARAPGVTVDPNDNLALRGRQNVLVLIDGKRQPMTGTELADYLRALPADQLKSIELITNPPAKYDAQGTAGVIAITLRKDSRLGTNGTLQGSYGRSNYNKYTAGISLNHRTAGPSGASLNVFGSYNFADRMGISLLDISRIFYAVNPGGERTRRGGSEQLVQSFGPIRSNTARAGFDYSPSKRTMLGAVVSAQQNQTPGQLSVGLTGLSDAAGRLTETYEARNERQFQSPNAAVNLNVKHVFSDAPDSPELTADADYARYRTSRLQELTMTALPAGRSYPRLAGDQQGDLRIWSTKADYILPLKTKGRLELGAKVSRVTSDNDVVFRFHEGASSTIDASRTNGFRYNETISAAYASWSRVLAKTTLQLGLRAEQTLARGLQRVGEQGFNRRYAQLFPNAAIKYSPGKNHELNIALNRRINRPSYGQLNPFRMIIDPTTAGAGNPSLQPETSYNIELAHTFKGKFTTSLSYSRTALPIIGVIQLETDSTVLSTGANLDRKEYFALTLTAPAQPSSWWQIYNNAVFYYSHFVGNLAGSALNKGRPAFTLSSNHTFTLGKGWSFELNGSFQSAEQYGFLAVNALGQVTAGLQKGLWNRKANLKLNVSDLFFTSKVRAVSAYDNYVENFYQRRDSRVATLSFSYRFGNEKVTAARRRESGAEEEKRRAN